MQMISLLEHILHMNGCFLSILSTFTDQIQHFWIQLVDFEMILFEPWRFSKVEKIFKSLLSGNDLNFNMLLLNLEF